LSEQIRNAAPTLKVQQHCGGGNFKKQMKKALSSGASLAIIVGDEELANSTMTLKFLTQDKAQSSLDISALASLTSMI
jgi:histidyl-tRNA synthetase